MARACALAIASALAAPSASTDREAFEAWKREFGRTYASPEEESRRFAVFQDNLRDYEARSAEDTATYGPDGFADRTDEEFRRARADLGLAARAGAMRDGSWLCSPSAASLPPSPALRMGNRSIDWRERGAVTPVKDQGALGSCWAFCGVGIMEGANVVQGGNPLQSLSEQELLDCPSIMYDDCGSTTNYYVDNHFAAITEASYPYEAARGSCRRSSGTASTATASHTVCVDTKPDGNQDDILDHLLQLGPGGFLVASSCLKGYRGGIISSCGQAAGTFDHATTLVGAGEENGVPYWLVKNSWGTSFGEAGFWRMQRNTNPPQAGVPGGIFALYGTSASRVPPELLAV